MDQPVSARRLPLHAALLAMAALPAVAIAQAVHDPMRPPMAGSVVRSPSTPAGPQLTAILQGESGRVAVFNGEFVRGGERVGDCLILAVLADGVRYRRGDRVLEVHLAPAGPSYIKPAAPWPGPPRGAEP